MNGEPNRAFTMKKLLRTLFGIEEMEQAISETIQRKLEVEQKLKETESKARELEDALKEEERVAKLSPKELATEKKEPYVAVLDTHVNTDNIRNGFFELDWNEYFVLKLKEAGYNGSSEEEIVDQWFQELCRNVGNEAGVNMERRSSGYINVNNIGDGKAEVS